MEYETSLMPKKVATEDQLQQMERHRNEQKKSRHEQLMAMCYLAECEPEDFRSLRRYRHKLEELEKRCRELEHLLEHKNSSCSCESKCDGLWRFITECYCPANQPFSRMTIDNFSSINLIELNQVVEGDGFENGFPVTPGQKIKLTHPGELPGFIPHTIHVDLNLANGGTNYLEIKLEFFLIGGPEPTKLGVTFRGNEFLNKDGGQIAVPFPTYKGHFIEVGFAQKLEVVISHTGLENNLTSAMVRVRHNVKEWYKRCRRYGYDCEVPGDEC